MPLSRRRTAAALTTAAAAVAATVLGTATPASAAVNVDPKIPAATPATGAAFLVPGQSLWRPSAAHPNSNRLTSVGLADDADSTRASSTLGGYLVLQSDGNLVEYASDSGQVLFSTGTRTGEKLAFQGDGNVVLYDATGRVLWQTQTKTLGGAYFGPYGNGEVVTQRADGQFVSAVGTATTGRPGVTVASVQSSDGRFRLQAQADGNLVEYQVTPGAADRAVWSTKTNGRGPVRLNAQSDGNLVLYQRSTGTAVWSTRTATGATHYRQLDVQDDGNVVLWSTDGVHRTTQLWSNGVHV